MPNDVDFSTRHSILGKKLLSADRLGRASWIESRIGANDLYLLQDGEFSRLLIQEVFECFLNGQYIATILLGFSFIERSIAGRLSFNGQSAIASKKSEDLISAGLANGWLSVEQEQSLSSLRQLRNAFAHFREPSAGSRPEISALLAAKTTPEYLEKCAKEILSAAIRVLNEAAI